MPIALLDEPRRIDDDVTRRQFMIGSTSAALVTGCASTAPAPTSPGADAGFPLTISHKYGSTEIQTAPKRVVAVGLTEQDPLLALGVTPVATREWFGDQPGALWPWARDLAGGDVPEALAFELSDEKIAALRRIRGSGSSPRSASRCPHASANSSGTSSSPRSAPSSSSSSTRTS